MSTNAKLSLAEELAALKAENAALKARAEAKVTLKVSQAGAVSVYGMGRFPVSLYQEQWLKLLDMAETIRGFISVHSDVLTNKGDDEAMKAAKLTERVKRGFAEAPKAAAAPASPPVTYAKVTRVAPR